MKMTLIAASLLTACNLFAQQLPSGSITVGYRFTDVNGYQPKYTELFGLNSGFRMLDFNLFSKPSEKTTDQLSRFLDSYSLTASGIGGEPFTTTAFTARKNNVYDLRVNLRQTHYYWDRNDQSIPAGSVAGLTSNHNWATVRKFGSANLLVHATKNVRFNFEYGRNTRDGVTYTTRPIDYFGSSSTWGSFARANPYYLIAPLSETTNRGTAGVDYTIHDWALHYKLGYQSFEDAVNLRNPTSPERSINTDPATAAPTEKEPLNATSWTDYRKLTTPVSEFSYTGRLLPKLEARGAYIFYRYQGPASLDMASNGTARTNTGGTTFAPYIVSLTSTAQVTEPNHVAEQGFTFKAKDWWSIFADYRYSRFTVDSTAQFRSVLGSAVSSGSARNQWRISTSTADLTMAFTPVSNLLVRAGVRFMKDDVVMRQDGVTDTTRTKRIRTVWPIGSFFYEPTSKLTIRGDADQITIGTSYTRVTPRTDVGGRFVVRYRPVERFYLEHSGVFRNRTLLTSDFHSTTRSNATTANFELNERFTVFGGFSYDSFFASNNVSFLRGTAPFTNLALRDQTLSRVWQGGVRARPAKALGVDFSGNFVRTTGVGEIAGERPLYGPMTFPYATAALYYDVPRIGRMTLQLQRTYYIEQIVTSNNFSANLLSILYTRNF